jgi:hypothetical protein
MYRPGPLRTRGPITTRPFLKLPIAAKLGKPGHQFDDAGRGRGWLWVVVVGWVTIRKTAEQRLGNYGGSTAVLLCYYRRDHRLELYQVRFYIRS